MRVRELERPLKSIRGALPGFCMVTRVCCKPAPELCRTCTCAPTPPHQGQTRQALVATDHDMRKLPFESLPSISELFDHARTLVKEGKVEGRDARALAGDIITDAVHDWPELNKNALINKLRKMLVIIHRREDGTSDSFEGVILNPHNSQSYPVWVKGLDGSEWKGTYHKNQDPQVTHLERIEPAP